MELAIDYEAKFCNNNCIVRKTFDYKLLEGINDWIILYTKYTSRSRYSSVTTDVIPFAMSYSI